MKHRNLKVLRSRLVYYKTIFKPAVVKIADSCIGCGTCFEEGTFKAIETDNSFRIIQERYDDYDYRKKYNQLFH